ncbi:MAG: ABC transporter substrate-binding protein [Acetobacteraceae bacterium]
MMSIGRRELLAGTAAVAGGVLARPYVARAAAKTLTVWWNQGYYPTEDQAFREMVAEWEKTSGTQVVLSFLPDAAIDSKIVSAITSGVVPDLFYAEDASGQVIPQDAWAGKFVDVSDVVATQKGAYSPAALQSGRYYNNVEKKYSYYGVPLKAKALNIAVWRSLVEKAGFHASDIPKTWDAYFNFFKPVQDSLRKQGMRHVYGLGYSVSTIEDDSRANFNQFMIAYGGVGLVTPDGKLHVDDPQVKEAAIKAIEALTTPYKEGYVPPDAINWAGPDNNNAFHAKEVVMTPNYSTSISAAVRSNKQEYYHDIMTSPMPLDNAGKPVPSLLEVMLAVIPTGAKNVDAAKDFLRYMIVPKNRDRELRQALGRWLPVMPSEVHTDPYWLDPSDPHIPIAVRQGVLGPTVNWFYVFNPAYAVVNAKQVWGVAEADVIHGMPPEQAVEKAFAQIKDIFSQYQIT